MMSSGEKLDLGGGAIGAIDVRQANAAKQPNPMIAAAASTMRIRSLERSFLYIISLHNSMGDLGLVIVPLCRSDDAQSLDSIRWRSSNG